jgi:hypothetical protein
MAVEIHISDLTVEHLRRYDRIDAVAGDTAYEPDIWTKPKMAGFVSPLDEAPMIRIEALVVRIDKMDDEHLRQLSHKIERLQHDNRKAKA